MSAMVDLEQFRAPVQEWKDKVLLPRWYHDQDEARHDEADRLLAIIDGAKAAALRQSGEAVATLPIDVRGQWFDVPIPVHLHLIALREQLACDVSGQPFIRNLLVHTEHCLSAADEGVDYAVSREMMASRLRFASQVSSRK